MRHLMQPNRWSCSITSAAMVMGITIQELVDEIGHDGSNKVFPDLPEPMCFAGFDISEIVDAAFDLGWSMTPINTIPTCTPDGENIRDVYPESKIMDRVNHYLDHFDAIGMGQRYGGNNWHTIAWSKDEQRWHDPSGPILQKDKPPIQLATLWVFSKLENPLQRLLSPNS